MTSVEQIADFAVQDTAWMPLHHAAAILVDYLKASPLPDNHIVHLVHPRPVPWSQLAAVFSRELSVPVVPYSEWLAKLEDAANSVSQNGSQDDSQREVEMMTNIRALRLLPFFKDVGTNGKSGNSFGMQALDVKQAIAASATMADPAFPQLDADDVRRWLAYWRSVKLLPAA